MLFTTTSVTSG